MTTDLLILSSPHQLLRASYSVCPVFCSLSSFDAIHYSPSSSRSISLPLKIFFSIFFPLLLIHLIFKIIPIFFTTDCPESFLEKSPSSSVDLMELASGNYGCRHYRRRCKIRAPCCNEIFDCRHCHNEAKNSLNIDLLDRHDIPRFEIRKVICSLCGVEQDVRQNCINCGILMGKYFCSICNFFDDDVLKKQYHCDECGICRTGGKENFFHCSSCGCCYAKIMEGTHRCLEKAMHHDCPVCCEYLFDTTKDVSVLTCGHMMHLECAKQMEQHYRYACPICLKSMCDMSKVWKKLDEEVASTPLPEECQRMVRILCNDCEANSEVQYHVLAHKCPNCSSYNTKLI